MQEYASLLRIQALEQRLAIVRAELSEVANPAASEPMQDA